MPNAQSAMLALLLPAGLVLILVAGLAGRRPARSAVAGLGAMALAAISLWCCGFAFQMGGVGLVTTLPGLEGLVWEWASPLRLEWGVLGLRGFFLLGDAATPSALTLYLAVLGPLAIAVLVPMLALRERMPGWMAAMGAAFVALLVYPVAGNWVSGGGWLMRTGETLGLGHGFVDQTGASSAAVVGGLTALLGILIFSRRLPPVPVGEVPALPPVYLPVVAMLGTFLIVVGGMGLAGANPIQSQAGLSAPQAGVNLVMAGAGGAFLPCLYTWFVAGSADSLMAARGAAAGVLAVAASMALVPAWAALALGALTGLLVPLMTYLVRYALRIDDPTGALPVALLGGTLGMLAPGLLSDGRAGAGWNGIGPAAYLGVAGQGVTGLFAAGGKAVDWPGQMNAQLLGLAAIAALTVALVGLLFLVLRVVLVLWRAIPAPEHEE